MAHTSSSHSVHLGFCQLESKAFEVRFCTAQLSSLKVHWLVERPFATSLLRQWSWPAA